jgi:hypothetical protein
MAQKEPDKKMPSMMNNGECDEAFNQRGMLWVAPHFSPLHFGANGGHCFNCIKYIGSLVFVLDTLSEIALSHLDTQWGFNDTTPVEGR